VAFRPAPGFGRARAFAAAPAAGVAASRVVVAPAAAAAFVEAAEEIVSVVFVTLCHRSSLLCE
jgi:hypothetical protein